MKRAINKYSFAIPALRDQIHKLVVSSDQLECIHCRKTWSLYGYRLVDETNQQTIDRIQTFATFNKGGFGPATSCKVDIVLYCNTSDKNVSLSSIGYPDKIEPGEIFYLGVNTDPFVVRKAAPQLEIIDNVKTTQNNSFLNLPILPFTIQEILLHTDYSSQLKEMLQKGKSKFLLNIPC